MTKEAMKLALEALETSQKFTEACADGKVQSGWGDQLDDADKAITALQEALAEQPAQQEPDWLDKQQTETDWDHVWLLIKAASYASSKGFISGTTNWGSAVSRYMRNESLQPAQRKPLTDAQMWSLWNSQGDDAMEQTAASAIAFARAIEAAHGIKDQS